MRPRGAVRKAVSEFFADEGTRASWRCLAAKLSECGLIDDKAPSELRLVRKAVENAKQAGEIEPKGGEVRACWSRRPLKLYGARKAVPPATARQASAELAALIGNWPAPSE